MNGINENRCSQSTLRSNVPATRVILSSSIKYGGVQRLTGLTIINPGTESADGGGSTNGVLTSP